MNELQRQKAIKALEHKKAKERRQFLAMVFRMGAYAKLHIDGVLLPYKILYSIEKQEHEGTFKEIAPNPFYPSPAVTRETLYSKPNYTGDYKDLELTDDGLPIFTSNAEYKRQWEEYQRRIVAEKTPAEMWAFWYARFLLPYDLSSFTDFDWWGELPKTEEEREVINNLKAACMEVQADCRRNPQDYNANPVLKKEEHKAVFDVDSNYI